METAQRAVRGESAQRWTSAAKRAVAEGIRVRQLQSSGQWVCKSGTDEGIAYEISVTGNVAHGCDCLAGLNGDPVCKHRAAFYLMIGALSIEQASIVSQRCRSCTAGRIEAWGVSGPIGCQVCSVCGGTGRELPYGAPTAV